MVVSGVKTLHEPCYRECGGAGGCLHVRLDHPLLRLAAFLHTLVADSVPAAGDITVST